MENELKNPLQQAWEMHARTKAEEFAGEEVWEALNEVDREWIVGAAKIVMRKEIALAGVV